MRFASAMSEHPLATHAVGEVIGQVMDQVGESPDLAVLFATAPHLAAFNDIADAVHRMVQPSVLIGATAVSAVGGDREVEESPAVSLWAGRTGPATPLHLRAQQTIDGWQLTGLPQGQHRGTIMVLPDPFTFPTDVLLRGVETGWPDMQIIGGLASAGRAPGQNRLALNDQVFDTGAVGVLLEDSDVTTVVSQGCRPVGDPFTITRGEGNRILELGGKPAAQRLREMVDGLSPDDRELLRRGLHVGTVVNEQQMDFGRGDFLIRAVQGVDKATGSVAIGDHAHIGTTVQFQLRDASTADEDLREMLAGQQAEAGLLFTCNGRGRHLFDEPHHDAAMVSQALDGGPLAGMFCAGEIGPIGGRNFLHGFTASVALFGT